MWDPAWCPGTEKGQLPCSGGQATCEQRLSSHQLPLFLKHRPLLDQIHISETGVTAEGTASHAGHNDNMGGHQALWKFAYRLLWGLPSLTGVTPVTAGVAAGSRQQRDRLALPCPHPGPTFPQTTQGTPRAGMGREGEGGRREPRDPGEQTTEACRRGPRPTLAPSLLGLRDAPA